MNSVVVDTNVAIVANGRNTHADFLCQLACVEKLEEVVRSQIVAIDDTNLIFEEYKNYLKFSGAPGVGDMFFKHLGDHQYSENKIKQVGITHTNDMTKGFAELPKNKLDVSDRKFLAVAVVAKATILNATDSDWFEHKDLTDKLGVIVEQLCPQYSSRCKD